MTQEEIDHALEELERAKRIGARITPSPWSEDELFDRINDFDDCQFILYARNELLPNFIKMLGDAIEELKKLNQALKPVQQIPYYPASPQSGYTCMFCGGWISTPAQHNCRMFNGGIS